MTTIKVFRLDNTEAETYELNDKIAQAPFNPFIVKDAVVYQRAKTRQGTHKVKGRSEVAGSGKKLYRQKGTGNARVGNKKPPHWRKGGVAFGPVVRDHSISLNKKVRKSALVSVIGEKIRNNQFLVVDELKLADHRTKNLANIIKGFELSKILFVYSENDRNFDLASRNLPGTKVVHSSGLNIYDMLCYKNVVIDKNALQEIEKRLLR